QLIYSPAVLPYSCPLIRDKIPLEKPFINATYTVWKHLIQDPLIYDLVDMDSEDLRLTAYPLKENTLPIQSVHSLY
ncbi:MAG: hypothetical protein RRY25_05045, partial [Anaerovorax sp.]